MKCEQCTSLQEPGEDSLQTSFLDIPQWLQSNGNLTPAKCCESAEMTDGSPICECGKGMSNCSIHPNTPDEWIASMRDSLAKTLARLESKLVSAKEPALGFTEKSCVLLAQLNPDSYSWKMSPRLKATDLKRLSKTWPSWGMTVDGCAYEHPMSGHRITEIGGLRYAMPTPVRAMEAPNKRSNSKGPKNLVEIAQGKWEQFWPTPNASDCRDRGNLSDPCVQRRISIGKQIGLSTAVKETQTGGTLNPQWVEWLMGWPIGHTASKHLETVKYHSKSQSLLPSWLRA